MQDTTIRWVLEYSEAADFSNLKPLDLSRPVFDSTLSIDPSGEDIDIEFDGVTGSVNSGRFVFAKVDPNDEFKFPRTKMLENGNFYFFKNYKVRDGCVSPPIGEKILHVISSLTVSFTCRADFLHVLQICTRNTLPRC